MPRTVIEGQSFKYFFKHPAWPAESSGYTDISSVSAPDGFQFLLGQDGEQLLGADGQQLYGVA